MTRIRRPAGKGPDSREILVDYRMSQSLKTGAVWDLDQIWLELTRLMDPEPNAPSLSSHSFSGGTLGLEASGFGTKAGLKLLKLLTISFHQSLSWSSLRPNAASSSGATDSCQDPWAPL